MNSIGLECISAVIAMAFAVEALVNFVGAAKIPTWDERASYRKKTAALESRFQIGFSSNEAMFETLRTLKDVRDALAHGKPVERIVLIASDRSLGKEMQPSWSFAAVPEFVFSASIHLTEFEQLLFSRARIKRGSALTSAMSLPDAT